MIPWPYILGLVAIIVTGLAWAWREWAFLAFIGWLFADEINGMGRSDEASAFDGPLPRGAFDSRPNPHTLYHRSNQHPHSDRIGDGGKPAC